MVSGLAVVTTSVVSANEPLSIRVSPTISFAPANLVIRIRIESDANNSALEVVADSGGFSRSSSIQLDGDRAPKTTMFEFRNVPAGEYEITAVMIGTDGYRTPPARAFVKVIQ